MAFDYFQGDDGKWHWRHRSGDGSVTESPQLYDTEAEVREAIAAHRADIAGDPERRVGPPAPPNERRTFLGFSAKDVAVPILVGIIAGLVTTLTTLYTVRANVASDARAKAADIIFAGNPTPAEIQFRRAALSEIYPEIPLPSQDPSIPFWGTDAEIPRLVFLQQAVGKASCPEQVVALWRQMWGPERARDEKHIDWITSVTVPVCPATGP